MAPEEILPVEAYTRATGGEWRLVDVRSPQEFAQGHPDGAINIPIAFRGPMGMQPNPSFVQAFRHVFPDRNQPLVLTCGNGPRSGRGCDLLAQAGYLRLANMVGGMFGAPDVPGWEAKGLPVSVDTQGVSREDVKP